MMLHCQARVIVLIILPEMQLIKKESAEVPLQSLGGIITEFTGINQAKGFTQELLTILGCLTHHQHTEGLPLHVCVPFAKAVPAFLAISPEITTFIPQGAAPASGHSASWRANIEGQQREWIWIFGGKICEFNRKDEWWNPITVNSRP